MTFEKKQRSKVLWNSAFFIHQNIGQKFFGWNFSNFSQKSSTSQNFLRTKKFNFCLFYKPTIFFKYQSYFSHKNLVRTFPKNLENLVILACLWTKYNYIFFIFDPFSWNTNLIFSRKIWLTRLLMNEVQLYKLE